MKLLELELKNVKPFKSALLDLDYEGVTVIKGLNKDDGPKASNAAGKSRLISALPDLVLDESPNGKEDKIKGQKRKKQLTRVRFMKGKHEYDITKKIGKGKSYEIVKDGKSIDVRTVKYSQQKIQKLFGMSETQFYTRFYIDGTIPHVLITGSAKHRQEYIVDLFDLGNIDSIRRLLNAELTAVSKKAVEYKTVKRTLDELREDLLPKEKRIAIRERLEKLKSKQERLSESLKNSQHVSQLLTFERQNKQLLGRFHKLGITSDPAEELQDLRKRIGRIQLDRSSYHEWEAYDKALNSWKKSFAPVKQMLDRLGTDLETAKKKAHEAGTAAAQLSALDAARDPGTKPELVERPKFDHDECKIKVRHYKDELEHSKSFKDGRCSLCGSKVKARSRDEIKADLEKWVKRINACEKYVLYENRIREWKERKRAYDENVEQANALSAKIEARAPYVDVVNAASDLRAKPQKPLCDRPKEFDEALLERLERRRELLRSIHDVWTTIQELQTLTVEKRATAEEAESQVQRLNEIMGEINDLTTKDVKQQEVIRRMRGLKERCAALWEECKDEKLLKALVGAYSTSGLKKFMIERYSKLLEQQINKYRKMFFSEDYTFEFQYDNGLKVLVHRKYGKRVETSDVRKLSGAEKRFFTLLSVVATNTMLPAKKRLNVLILDEPESQMGEPAIERFVQTLSILRRLVPHIIVVTPKTSLDIPDSRSFTVVKQNGISRLVRDKTRGVGRQQDEI